MKTINVVPPSPKPNSWKKGANGVSIQKGTYYGKKDYQELAETLLSATDRVKNYSDPNLIISEVMDSMNSTPRHIRNKINHLLDKNKNSSRKLIECLYQQILCYSGMRV